MGLQDVRQGRQRDHWVAGNDRNHRNVIRNGGGFEGEIIRNNHKQTNKQTVFRHDQNHWDIIRDGGCFEGEIIRNNHKETNKETNKQTNSLQKWSKSSEHYTRWRGFEGETMSEHNKQANKQTNKQVSKQKNKQQTNK